MAKRNSKYIKKITSKDTKLLKQLSRTGISTNNQINRYTSLSQARLTKLENSNFIKSKNVSIEGVSRKIYSLDAQGKEYCKTNLGVERFAVAQSNHYTHDIKLTEMYYTLPEEVQETWKAENQLVKDIKNKFPDVKLKTCLDATVEWEGETIGIEAIGDTYTVADVELKESIAKDYLGCNSVLKC